MQSRKKIKNLFREEDLEQYKKYLTVKKNCFVCNSNKYKVWARWGRYKAVRCSRCGFIWINPFLNNQGLNQYYSDYIQRRRLSNKKKMQLRESQYQIDKGFIENFISSGKVLDIGCNGGFFLDVLSKRFEKHGIDIDEQAVEYARKHYPFGKNVICIDLADAPYPRGFFDLIIMRGTIEHLPNPVSAILKVSQLLKPHGYYYITATPNVNSFCADLYRERWNLFHPVQHIFYFSPETLSKICSKFKLKLIAKDFPYLETPYINVKNDHKEVLRAVKLKEKGKKDVMKISPAFWGNMMSLVFRKLY